MGLRNNLTYQSLDQRNITHTGVRVRGRQPISCNGLGCLNKSLPMTLRTRSRDSFKVERKAMPAENTAMVIYCTQEGRMGIEKGDDLKNSEKKASILKKKSRGSIRKKEDCSPDFLELFKKNTLQLEPKSSKMLKGKNFTRQKISKDSEEIHLTQLKGCNRLRVDLPEKSEEDMNQSEKCDLEKEKQVPLVSQGDNNLNRYDTVASAASKPTADTSGTKNTAADEDSDTAAVMNENKSEVACEAGQRIMVARWSEKMMVVALDDKNRNMEEVSKIMAFKEQMDKKMKNDLNISLASKVEPVSLEDNRQMEERMERQDREQTSLKLSSDPMFKGEGKQETVYSANIFLSEQPYKTSLSFGELNTGTEPIEHSWAFSQLTYYRASHSLHRDILHCCTDPGQCLENGQVDVQEENKEHMLVGLEADRFSSLKEESHKQGYGKQCSGFFGRSCGEDELKYTLGDMHKEIVPEVKSDEEKGDEDNMEEAANHSNETRYRDAVDETAAWKATVGCYFGESLERVRESIVKVNNGMFIDMEEVSRICKDDITEFQMDLKINDGLKKNDSNMRCDTGKKAVNGYRTKDNGGKGCGHLSAEWEEEDRREHRNVSARKKRGKLVRKCQHGPQAKKGYRKHLDPTPPFIGSYSGPKEPIISRFHKTGPKKKQRKNKKNPASKKIPKEEGSPGCLPPDEIRQTPLRRLGHAPRGRSCSHPGSTGGSGTHSGGGDQSSENNNNNGGDKLPRHQRKSNNDDAPGNNPQGHLPSWSPSDTEAPEFDPKGPRKKHITMSDADCYDYLGKLISKTQEEGNPLYDFPMNGIQYCLSRCLSNLEFQTVDMLSCSFCNIVNSLMKHYADCQALYNDCKMCVQIFSLICGHVTHCTKTERCAGRLCDLILQHLNGESIAAHMRSLWFRVRKKLARLIGCSEVAVEPLRELNGRSSRSSRTQSTSLQPTLPSIPETGPASHASSSSSSQVLRRKLKNLPEENASCIAVDLGDNARSSISPAMPKSCTYPSMVNMVLTPTKTENSSRIHSLPIGPPPVWHEPSYPSYKDHPTGTKGIGEVVVSNKKQLKVVAQRWSMLKSRIMTEGRLGHHYSEEGVILENYQDRLVVSGIRYGLNFQWERLSHLGNGMSGKCSLAKDFTTDFMFCVKEIDISRYESEEIELWIELDCPHIVKLYGATRHAEKIFIFMEFIDGGCLTEVINQQKLLNQRLSQRTALLYFRQILQALVYLKSKQILHEDLKADNLLLHKQNSKIHIKVTDFGLARRCQKLVPKNTKPIGTQTQWSPQKAKGDQYGFCAEVWAAACILIHMLSGSPPWIKRFGQQANKTLIFVIVEKSPPVEDIPRNIDGAIRDLLKIALTLDRDQRPTAEQLLRNQAFSLLDDDPTNNYSMLDSGVRLNTQLSDRTNSDLIEIVQGLTATSTAKDSTPTTIYPQMLQGITDLSKGALDQVKVSDKGQIPTILGDVIGSIYGETEAPKQLQSTNIVAYPLFPKTNIDPTPHLWEFIRDISSPVTPPDTRQRTLTLYKPESENEGSNSRSTSDSLSQMFLPKFDQLISTLSGSDLIEGAEKFDSDDEDADEIFKNFNLAEGIKQLKQNGTIIDNELLESVSGPQEELAVHVPNNLPVVVEMTPSPNTSFSKSGSRMSLTPEKRANPKQDPITDKTSDRKSSTYHVGSSSAPSLVDQQAGNTEENEDYLFQSGPENPAIFLADALETSSNLAPLFQTGSSTSTQNPQSQQSVFSPFQDFSFVPSPTGPANRTVYCPPPMNSGPSATPYLLTAGPGTAQSTSIAPGDRNDLKQNRTVQTTLHDISGTNHRDSGRNTTDYSHQAAQVSTHPWQNDDDGLGGARPKRDTQKANFNAKNETRRELVNILPNQDGSQVPTLHIDVTKAQGATSASRQQVVQTAPIISSPKLIDYKRMISTPKNNSSTSKCMSSSPVSTGSTSKSQFDAQEEELKILRSTVEKAMSEHSDHIPHLFDPDDEIIVDNAFEGFDNDNPAASILHLLDDDDDKADSIHIVFKNKSDDKDFKMRFPSSYQAKTWFEILQNETNVTSSIYHRFQLAQYFLLHEDGTALDLDGTIGPTALTVYAVTPSSNTPWSVDNGIVWRM